MTLFLFLTGCRDGVEYMFTKKDQSTTMGDKEIIVEESISKEGDKQNTVTKPSSKEKIVEVEGNEETKTTITLPLTIIPNTPTVKIQTTKPEDDVEETEGTEGTHG